MQLNVQAWYHGSPLQLEILQAGSTITPYRHLAEVFSHKPPIVCVDDAGLIQHNGTQPGFLYVIEEPLSEADVYMHPRSSMPAGWEWLTKRDVPLRLIGPVAYTPGELLSDAELAALMEKVQRAAAARDAQQAEEDAA
jgi:hypothetical protein